MAKSKDEIGAGKARAVSRRDLVTIVVKPDDARPFHIHAKSNNALLARVDKESIIDALLDRLDESVFYRT